MVRILHIITLIVFILLAVSEVHAQERLYPNEFSLRDVTLLDGPFKHARDLNIQTLLKYDVDRLLAPYRKEAGLPEKAPLYPKLGGTGWTCGWPLLISNGNELCCNR